MNSLLLSGWLAVTCIVVFACWVIIAEKLERRLQVGSVLATVALISVPLWYEFAGPYTTPVALLVNGVAELRPNGMFCWEFGQSYSAVPSGATSIGGSVRVITENPKVREIHYELNAQIADLDAWFAQPHRRKLKQAELHVSSFGTAWTTFKGQPERIEWEISKPVITQLFEFNETHSHELARFYNPLDPKQNEDLKQLLEPWLNERLAVDGIEVSYASFSLE